MNQRRVLAGSPRGFASVHVAAEAEVLLSTSTLLLDLLDPRTGCEVPVSPVDGAWQLVELAVKHGTTKRQHVSRRNE